MNNLLADAIDAHGGLRRWKELATVACDVNAFGELHRLKKSPPQSGPIHFIAKTTEQVCSITLPPEPGKPPLRSVASSNKVTVQSLEGALLAELNDPRESFTGHDLDTPWNPLQRLYFSSYAMWMYLTIPFSLAVEGAAVWDIDPIEENGETWRGIRVVMPPRFATHSRAQEYFFGDDGLLRRQDYMFDIATSIKIANYAHDIVEVDGIKLPSRRRAYLCNKRYEILPDKLMIGLDFTGLHASETHRAIF